MIRRLLNRMSRSPAPARPQDSPPPAGDDDRSHRPAGPSLDLDHLVRLVNGDGHPNINALWRLTKDLEAMRLCVKALGYELSRTLEANLQTIPVEPHGIIKLDSKPATQGDIEARWCRSWCATLRERPRYHRRLWESAFVLQALFEAEATLPGAKVLAVGPIDGTVVSFLARNDVKSTIWGPHRPGMREVITDDFTYESNVAFMPEAETPLRSLTGFDAVWSIGQAGRLGSIQAGMDFIVQSIDALRPGGTAVHVFDFNFADDEHTIDNWPAVLFQRRHIEAVATALEAKGHKARRLDFDVGHQPLDRFVDIPPFDNSRTEAFAGLWKDGWQGAHLKVSIDGFPVTSYGLICRRGDD